MKVLIPEDVHPFLIEKLAGCGMEVNHCPDASYGDVVNVIDSYDVLVVRSKFKVDGHFLDRAPNLKVIGRYGAGMEGIDIEECTKRGIKVFNSPEGNRNAVAEHALGLLLALTNKICKANNEVKKGKWDRNANWGTELEGKVVGIIGYGNTGSSFARKLLGFDTEVVAYDKYKSGFGNEYVKEVSIEYIYRNADIVSLHIPYNKENHYFAGRDFFASFHKPVFFLNTSRGKVTDTVALVDALKSGKVLAAGLDVLEYEKSDFESLFGSGNEVINELAAMDNVIITPHIAGWSNESYFKLAKVLAEKICRHLKG